MTIRLLLPLTIGLLLSGLAPGMGALLAASLAVGLAATVAQDVVPAAATLAPAAQRGRIARDRGRRVQEVSVKPFDRSRQLGRQLARVQDSLGEQIDAAEMRWLEVHEALEA